MCPHRVGDLLRELRPRLEDVAVARKQGAAVPFDVGEGTEAVHLRLEDPVRVERLREAEEAHWGDFAHRLAREWA